MEIEQTEAVNVLLAIGGLFSGMAAFLNAVRAFTLRKRERGGSSASESSEN